jgi:Heparan-alpha-glucosaminide N-acetyltransferase, catalytic
MKTKSSLQRLQYLDWVRGLGAAIMLQGHVFDSYLRPDLRPGGAFTFSQFIGGMPPAMFLFLTGVTLAFLMDSSERKGMAPRSRVWLSLRRAGYLFSLAFAFRAFMLISGYPVSTWSDFLRVDILNCMGFSIAALSVMAAFRTAERARLCAVLGLAIAFASPLVSQVDWSGVPWMLRAYIVPDHRFFGFFPWGAYLAFGVSAGSALRIIPAERLDRAMQWTAFAAAGAIACCQYCANAPYSIYAASDFWLNSPAQVLTKQSATLIMLAFAFVWTQYIAREGWSWLRQLGTTSLLVYWVHIELIYGRWMWFFKEKLNVPEAVALSVAVIVLMLGVSVAKTRRAELREWLERLSIGAPAKGLPDPLTVDQTD